MIRSSTPRPNSPSAPEQAAHAVGDGVEQARPARDRDAAVSELQQMPAQGVARLLVVRQHGIRVQVVTTDDRDPPTALLVSAKLAVEGHLESRVGVPRPSDNDGTHAVGAHDPHLCQFALRHPIGVRDLHRAAVLGCNSYHAACDLGEVRVADLVYEQPHGRGDAPSQAARMHVRHITEFSCDLLHVEGEFFRDSVAACHRPRCRCERDTGLFGDVDESQRCVWLCHVRWPFL